MSEPSELFYHMYADLSIILLEVRCQFMAKNTSFLTCRIAEAVHSPYRIKMLLIENPGGHESFVIKEAEIS